MAKYKVGDKVIIKKGPEWFDALDKYIGMEVAITEVHDQLIVDGMDYSNTYSVDLDADFYFCDEDFAPVNAASGDDYTCHCGKTCNSKTETKCWWCEATIKCIRS